MTTITASLTGGTAVELSSGRHVWRADEPADVGGTDAGPSPYELLLSALASCTCITLALYAARKGIVLRSVTATFEHGRIHRRDCEECEQSGSAYLDRIAGEIVIDADLDDDQRTRLSEVAVRCPVHRTLENQVVFADTVRFA